MNIDLETNLSSKAFSCHITTENFAGAQNAP
jgi:hypothetical protein